MATGNLIEKIWSNHQVTVRDEGDVLLYIDRHLVHEVTSPQAFDGLRLAGRRVRRADATLAVADHSVPTTRGRRLETIADPEAKIQVAALEKNCADFGIELYSLGDHRQGIVHVVGPEQGLTQPGMTIVCGDSHTATHGAFGALAFGIGTSEVEHVLATQTLWQRPLKTMRIEVTGGLIPGVTAKDMILAIIGLIGAGGGSGRVIEYAGSAVRSLTMEGRMTLCNMSIEAGARAGLVAPDDTTYAYLEGRALAPKGADWAAALAQWRQLASDPGARYDKEITMAAEHIVPQVTWGTSPEDVVPVTAQIPDPAQAPSPEKAKAMRRSLEYMGLEAGTAMEDIAIDRVFIGSCTNGRIEDLRTAAELARGRSVDARVQAMVVPGSGLVKQQAEAEGLDRIFETSGFEWREAGCSMCLAMNEDRLEPGERCASTSNRNFEGRQGQGGRTHLMSPMMATAAALCGHITDFRNLPRR